MTALERPRQFVDEQTRGPFRSFHHEHLCETDDGKTRMIDRIRFEASKLLSDRSADWSNARGPPPDPERDL